MSTQSTQRQEIEAASLSGACNLKESRIWVDAMDPYIVISCRSCCWNPQASELGSPRCS